MHALAPLSKSVSERGDQCGVQGGEIVLLSRILDQIVQLDAPVLEELYEFVVAPRRDEAGVPP